LLFRPRGWRFSASTSFGWGFRRYETDAVFISTSIFEGIEMTDFKKSQWTETEYSRDYRANADNFIPERKSLLKIAASFYGQFIRDGQRKRVMDLGCGDGILAENLLTIGAQMDVIAVDGSEDMLAAARRRLREFPTVEFRRLDFEDILAGGFPCDPFDFIASAFALHHLEISRKARLFESLRKLLKPGCYFVNVDIATSEQELVNDWYYVLWKEWILAHEEALGLKEKAASMGSLAEVPAHARVKPENHYDSLESQIAALRRAGFEAVECHYRYGLFSIYSGRKGAE
jgi:tRNA (cmo5U34)-methyltransferase